jgi:hypothetical protein
LVRRGELAGTSVDRRPWNGSEHFARPVVLLRNLELLHPTQLAPDKPDERVSLGALKIRPSTKCAISGDSRRNLPGPLLFPQSGLGLNGFQRIKAALKQRVIFDGRNLYDPDPMKALELRDYSVGRHPV